MKSIPIILTAAITAATLFAACGDKEENKPTSPSVHDTTSNTQDTMPVTPDTTTSRPDDYLANHVFEYTPLDEYLIGIWKTPLDCTVIGNTSNIHGYGIWDIIKIAHQGQGSRYTPSLTFDRDSVYIEHPYWYAYPSVKCGWYVVDSLNIMLKKKDGTDSLTRTIDIYQWTRDTVVVGHNGPGPSYEVYVRQDDSTTDSL